MIAGWLILGAVLGQTVPPPLVEAEPRPAPAEVAPAPAPPTAPEPQRGARRARLLPGDQPATWVLVGTELVAGAVLGGGIGASFGSQASMAAGGALGAATLGLGSLALLYFGAENVASTALLATLSGLAAGGALGATSGRPALGFYSALAVSQAALFGVLLVTLPIERISDGDAALVRSVALNATFATAFVVWLSRSLGRWMQALPVFYAPLVGMALGGLLAIPVDIDAGMADMLAFAPGVGGLMAGGLTYLLVLAERANKPDKRIGPAPAIAAAASYAGALLVLCLGKDEEAFRGEPSEARSHLGPLVVPTREGAAVGAVLSVPW